MRYILLDRIEQIDHSRRLRAVKTVSRSEDFFTDHFPGQPVMPGALLIECMAQAGTALLELSNDLRIKAILVMVERAKFKAPVRPGDTLLVDMSVRYNLPIGGRGETLDFFYDISTCSTAATWSRRPATARRRRSWCRPRRSSHARCSSVSAFDSEEGHREKEHSCRGGIIRIPDRGDRIRAGAAEGRR